MSPSTGNRVWWKQVENRSGDEEANGRYLPYSIKIGTHLRLKIISSDNNNMGNRGKPK